VRLRGEAADTTKAVIALQNITIQQANPATTSFHLPPAPYTAISPVSASKRRRPRHRWLPPSRPPPLRAKTLPPQPPAAPLAPGNVREPHAQATSDDGGCFTSGGGILSWAPTPCHFGNTAAARQHNLLYPTQLWDPSRSALPIHAVGPHAGSVGAKRRAGADMLFLRVSSLPQNTLLLHRIAPMLPRMLRMRARMRRHCSIPVHTHAHWHLCVPQFTGKRKPHPCAAATCLPQAATSRSRAQTQCNYTFHSVMTAQCDHWH